MKNMLGDNLRNGREECGNCGSRNTEITSSFNRGGFTPKKDFKCRDCDNEWTEYYGEECTFCGSNKTNRKGRKGVAPHRSDKVYYQCRECDQEFTK